MFQARGNRNDLALVQNRHFYEVRWCLQSSHSNLCCVDCLYGYVLPVFMLLVPLEYTARGAQCLRERAITQCGGGDRSPAVQSVSHETGAAAANARYALPSYLHLI